MTNACKIFVGKPERKTVITDTHLASDIFENSAAIKNQLKSEVYETRNVHSRRAHWPLRSPGAATAELLPPGTGSWKRYLRTQRASGKMQTPIAGSRRIVIDDDINYGENKLEIWTLCHVQKQILIKCENWKKKFYHL